MNEPVLVLYVEDNPENRRLVRRLVETQGWAYDEAKNGHEALTRLQRVPRPDIIVMDLAMPLLDGYRTTELIKQDPTLADLPVIALTAHTLSGDEEKALNAGCDAYLTKPLERGIFFETLGRFLPGVAVPPRPVPVPPALTPGHAETKTAAGLKKAIRCLESVIKHGGARNQSLRPAIEELRRLAAPPVGKNS